MVPRFGDPTNSAKVIMQRQQAGVILTLVLAHLADGRQVSLNALAIFLKAQLRAATETFPRILHKVKLKLVGVLRLFPALEVVENGRTVKLAP